MRFFGGGTLGAPGMGIGGGDEYLICVLDVCVRQISHSQHYKTVVSTASDGVCMYMRVCFILHVPVCVLRVCECVHSS